MAWAACLTVGLVAVVAWALILFVSTPVLVTLAMLPLIAMFHPLYSPVEMLYLILEGGGAEPGGWRELLPHTTANILRE